MESIVGIPEIEPRQVGRLGANAVCSIGRYLAVVVVNLQHVFLLGKAYRIEIVAIVGIINLQVAGFRLAITEKNGAVIGPSRINCRCDRTLLVLRNAENIPVIIVNMYVFVALNIMLVHPCAGKNIGISYGRYGGRLRVHAVFAATIGAMIVARTGNVHDGGRLKTLDTVGRNAVDNDKKGLARLAHSRQSRQ